MTTATKAEPLAPFAGFEAIATADLPKTVRREVSEEDKATQSALLAIVSQDGQSVRSTGTYPTNAEAAKVGGRLRRLLGRVVPDGKVARSRVVSDGDAFRWVLSLGTPGAPRKPRK